MTTTATVVGFGGRTPPIVLDLLSKCVATHGGGIDKIVPVRSSGISLALCGPPYRVFLDGNNKGSDEKEKERKSLYLYCLPASTAEGYNFYSEVLRCREKIVIGGSAITLVYDPTTDSFLGCGDSQTVLDLLSGRSSSIAESLSSAAMLALVKLDKDITDQILAKEGKKDTVIVVGSGGREHALAVALAKSPLIEKVLCCPGNAGTATEANPKIRNEGANQKNETVIALVKETNARMVVVGPEQPLVDGLTDELHQAFSGKVLVFGPSQAAAQLEASKAFTKDFLAEHDIPTAKYQNFTDPNEAVKYIESLDIDEGTGKNRQVVKASGLAAGKGVLLPTTKQETVEAVREIMCDKAFGNAGDTCVVESFLEGPEASCFALCDGNTCRMMPASQDHKRALDGDGGLNTGGMGAYAPAPCVTPDLQAEIARMCLTTVRKMKERGTPYVGLLYAGVILTPNGPYLLEYNCRFGDPETQVVLPLLETDLYEIMVACCTGTLDSVDVRFKENTSAATIVCAANGYPEKYPKGMEITGLADANNMDGVKVYHAGTKLTTTDDDTRTKTCCSGGRVLAVTGMGQDLHNALQTAYKGVGKLSFVGPNTPDQKYMHYRTDIGKKAVEKKLRIGVLGSTRGTALLPIIEACAKQNLHAEIVAVISNKSKALILEKGRGLGVTTKFISAKNKSREQYDAECTSALLGAGVECVLLIGYMRILSKAFTDFWKGRCMNVHPSLLPKFAGGMDLEVHQAAIDAGETESGCTIHEVSEVVDGGPILVQKKVAIDPGETAESLKAKVQPLEGPAFIEAIENFCNKNTMMTYADAGVDIDAGNNFVDMIKPLVKETRRAGCDADLGGFGGLFDLAAAGYDSQNTVLIGATDGVGTKLKIAQATGKHDTIGIDLVAMCVNDLIVAGGEPLFFLDYFATGKLKPNEDTAIVKGIVEGCKQAQCGLIGGETAEMPSMYDNGKYDLAGFSVGAVPKDKILPSTNLMREGDAILGLPSSGIHSNGFSLVRKLIEKEGLDYSSPCPWEDTTSTTVGESLLTPTKIYVKSCLPLIKEGLIKGMAHITGGGLMENVPRVLPDGIGADILHHPPLPSVFGWIKNASGLDDIEMLRTFNCGIGMVLIVDKDDVTKVKQLLQSQDDVYDLGVLVKKEGVHVSSITLA